MLNSLSWVNNLRITLTIRESVPNISYLHKPLITQSAKAQINGMINNVVKPIYQQLKIS